MVGLVQNEVQLHQPKYSQDLRRKVGSTIRWYLSTAPSRRRVRRRRPPIPLREAVPTALAIASSVAIPSAHGRGRRNRRRGSIVWVKQSKIDSFYPISLERISDTIL